MRAYMHIYAHLRVYGCIYVYRRIYARICIYARIYEQLAVMLNLGGRMGGWESCLCQRNYFLTVPPKSFFNIVSLLNIGGLFIVGRLEPHSGWGSFSSGLGRSCTPHNVLNG